MADEITFDVRTAYDKITSTFASATLVESGRMVYLDFIQVDPTLSEEGENPVATTVARIVLHPEVARGLAQQLSELGDE